jgi:hypothetical protein
MLVAHMYTKTEAMHVFLQQSVQKIDSMGKLSAHNDMKLKQFASHE